MSNILDCSGYIDDRYNYDEKIIELDFSGNEGDSCLRNDASILFFASNSYRSAFQSIEYHLETAFENKEKRTISHLILPYYFNFRHFVELRLKALYATITNESPRQIHNLTNLLDDVKNNINNINYENIDNIYAEINEENFEDIKNKLLQIIKALEKEIDTYLSTEPSVEYYRYIFEKDKKDLCLKNPVIKLDFNNVKKIFKNVLNHFDELCKQLKKIMYIIYSF